MRYQSCEAVVLGAFLALVLSSGSGLSAQEKRNQPAATQDVKARVDKFVAGKPTRVTVRLHDGEKLKGHISAIDDDTFSITNRNTGQQFTVSYEEVAKLKRAGLSTGLKIAIWSGVACGALFTMGPILLGR